MDDRQQYQDGRPYRPDSGPSSADPRYRRGDEAPGEPRRRDWTPEDDEPRSGAPAGPGRRGYDERRPSYGAPPDPYAAPRRERGYGAGPADGVVGGGGAGGGGGRRGTGAVDDYDYPASAVPARSGAPRGYSDSPASPVPAERRGAVEAAPWEPGAPGTVNRDLDVDDMPPAVRSRGGGTVGGGGAGKKKRSRKRTIIKWTAISVSTVLVAVLGFGVYVYKTTIGDTKHTALLPNGFTQAALPPDPYGGTEMNILLIGSDTRDTSSDCSLGGDCVKGQANVGANADSEMVLHVSGNRSNATVMSIPRDTVTEVPTCTTNKSTGVVTVAGWSEQQINAGLQGGPECQVAAVNKLTGITITGYIMFDFSGVVSMSNALGGVPVCVTKAVDDKFPLSGSGLKLPAGDSVIQGEQALEFLRTRDSFFDGSDLGREEATHYFLSQMIQTLRTKLNFTSIGTLLSIGQAAAKSVTVSDNFSGLSNLEGLVESLDKVPTKNITFLTMPWEYDPDNADRVIVNQGPASTVFQDIQNDVSYTSTSTASAKAPASPSASAPASTTSVDKAAVTVGVYNGDGVNGRASTIAKALIAKGFSKSTSLGDAAAATTTMVYYPSGDAAQGNAVAAALKLPSSHVKQSTAYSHVVVILGSDFDSGTTYTVVSTPTNTSAATAGLPSTSFAVNADSTGECIPVMSGNLNMAYK